MIFAVLRGYPHGTAILINLHVPIEVGKLHIIQCF